MLGVASKCLEDHPSVVAVSSHLNAMLESLKCRICLEAMVKPCRLLCGHSFCRVCVENFIQSSDGRTPLNCPLCKAPGLTKRSLRPHQGLSSLVAAVRKLREQIVEAAKDAFDFQSVEKRRGIGAREAPRTPVVLLSKLRCSDRLGASRMVANRKSVRSELNARRKKKQIANFGEIEAFAGKPKTRSARPRRDSVPASDLVTSSGTTSATTTSNGGEANEPVDAENENHSVDSEERRVETRRKTLHESASPKSPDRQASVWEESQRPCKTFNNKKKKPQTSKDAAAVIVSEDCTEMRGDSNCQVFVEAPVARYPRPGGSVSTPGRTRSNQTAPTVSVCDANDNDPVDSDGSADGHEEASRVRLEGDYVHKSIHRENRPRVVFECRGKMRPDQLPSPKERKKRVPFFQLGVLAPKNLSENQQLFGGVPPFQEILLARAKRRRERMEGGFSDSGGNKRSWDDASDRSGEENCAPPPPPPPTMDSVDVPAPSDGTKKFKFKSSSSLSSVNRAAASKSVESVEMLDSAEGAHSLSVLLSEEPTILINRTKGSTTGGAESSEESEVSSLEIRVQLERLEDKIRGSDLAANAAPGSTIDGDDSDEEDMFADTPQEVSKRTLVGSRLLGQAEPRCSEEGGSAAKAKRSLVFNVSPEAEKPKLNPREVIDRMSVTFFSSFEFLLHGEFSQSSEDDAFGKHELARVIQAGGGVVVRSVHTMSFKRGSIGLCVVDVDRSASAKKSEYERIFTCSGVAVVSKHWLLRCLREGKLVSIRPYLQHECDRDSLLNADYPEHLVS